MTDDDRFYVEVEYSTRGMEVTGLRLAETVYSQTIAPPNWLERKFGITFEGQANAAVERAQRICDRLNKRLDGAKRVCEAVEEQS